MNISNYLKTITFLLFLLSQFRVVAQCDPDITGPIAVCNNQINVSLAANGLAVITPDIIDENSYDDCCLEGIKIRRENATCIGFEDDANFGDNVTFCCDDIGTDAIVVLEVSDCSGNTNLCWSTLIIEDKVAPVLVSCPAAMTTTCGFYNDNVEGLEGSDLEAALNQNFGIPTFQDNCVANVSVQYSFDNANTCGDFTLTRTWLASDLGNNISDDCSQTVEVIFNDQWDVTFPADTTISCGGSILDYTEEPQLTSGSCGIIGIAYEDIVIASAVECQKVLRTWTVINWCNGEVKTQIQIIRLFDDINPTVLCPADFVVFTNPNNQLANITLALPEIEDCTDNPTVSASSNLPNFNANAFSAANVPAGDYSVDFLVTDACGNSTSCTTAITVQDTDDDCVENLEIDCDFYFSNLDAMLSQLDGDGAAQSQFLDQFFGAPDFDAGQNIVANTNLSLDQCGSGQIIRTWSLMDTPPNPSGDGFTLVIDGANVTAGQQFCVDVRAYEFTDILSMQFTVAFDESVLAFDNVSNFNLPGLDMDDFGLINTENGFFTFVWFDPVVQGVSIDDGGELFQICFTAIGGNDASSSISIEDAPTEIEVTNLGGNELAVNQINGTVFIGSGTPPNSDCLTLGVSQEMAENGEQVCVNMTTQNFDNILSMQYSVSFDEDVLTFAEIKNYNLAGLSESNFGLNNTGQGVITTSWFNAPANTGLNVADGTVLYQMCFDVIGQIGTVSPINFGTSFLLEEFIDGNSNSVCFSGLGGAVSVVENKPNDINNAMSRTGEVLCEQIITVHPVSDFGVSFPPDVTVECTGATLEAGEVELFGESCELVAVAYEDVIFTNSNDGCYAIERKYTVINWCVVGQEIDDEVIEVPESQLAAPHNDLDGDGDSDDRTFRDSWNGIDFPDADDAGTDGAPDTDPDNNPWDGFITYTQNIVVNDNAAPMPANNCLIPPVCINATFNCVGTLNLPEPSFVDCSPLVEVTVSSDLGTGFGPFNDVAPGNYNATFTATDPCGNATECTTMIEVINCAVPVAICDEAVVITLNNNGMTTLLPTTIDDGSYNSCGGDLDFSFPSGSNITFDCSDLGENFVELIVTNEGGNSNSCFTTVNVVDNLNVCPADPCSNLPSTLNFLACNNLLQVSLAPQGADIFISDVLEGIPANCIDNYNLSFSNNGVVEVLHFDCDDIGDQLVTVTDLDNGNSCWGTISIQDIIGVCDGNPFDCNNDLTPPVAVCDNGLVATLTNVAPSYVQIWADDFDEGSYDNCSDVVLSFSEDITDNSRIFDCEDIGPQPVEVWVTDEAGNQNTCFTFLVIQDGLGLCGITDDCINDEEAPLAFCVNGLVINIPTSGELTLNASNFDVGSIDNCTEQEDLQLSIELTDSDGNTLIPATSSITFTTDHIGTNNIVLYVEDEAGNVSECHTLFLLQSNPPKYITGKIFIDGNDDCTYNTGEQGLDTWSVKLELIDDPLATEPGIVLLPSSFSIDTDGNYTLTLPNDFEFFTPDSSVVAVNNLNAYLRLSLATTFNYGQSCDYNYYINAATNVQETVNVDFPVQIIEDCPQLSVDISTPFLRRCFENNYYVQYCNYGNVPVDGAFIEIEFDDDLLVNNSSLPWSAVEDRVYTFVLGTVGAAECGEFVINTTVSCESELGQTHCVDARIFPDVLCTEEGMNYTGPNIDITGDCDGEEVRFVITNNGDDMNDEIHYIIVEDFIMYNTTPQSLQLNSGESEEVVLPNNGSTWRLQTGRIAEHPTGGAASFAIEGCTLDGEFSTGFVTQFTENDNNPVISINCMENIGSFDPNDKTALPRGYGEEHYIEANTDLEYLIRFQNTGTDTAFNVVILDTLSAHLDPASVRPGASSHAYDFTILGDNVLKFNFDNIMLPDSNVNEPLSNGYVSFRVSQLADVALETVIENDAAIYFDFNEPIITNTVFHTIGDHFIEMPNNAVNIYVPAAEVNVYPNPFRTEMTVAVEGVDITRGIFNIIDVHGRTVKTVNFNSNQIQIQAQDLAVGMYFYQIFDGNTLIATGKISRQ